MILSLLLLLSSMASFADIEVSVPDNMPVPLEIKSMGNYNERQQAHILEGDHSKRISHCLQQMFTNLDRLFNNTPFTLREVQPYKAHAPLVNALKNFREKGLNPRGRITLERSALRVSLHYTEDGKEISVPLHNFAMDLGGNLSYSICSASQGFHSSMRLESYGANIFEKIKNSDTKKNTENLVREVKEPANH